MAEDSDYPEIDSEGPELVYMVVANHIAGRIDRGELRPGQRLPSELDLAAQYGVARMTVRRAMKELRERGLIRSVHGKGTYVQQPAPPAENADG
ncbi:winged helix-turn-helix domain-containing protein [Nonomuraea sp. NPDC049725]|uniref:GntR family transcriptional regulator n=1 Tax=Nonomuraea sp. NPDC049725 TaxID=3154508 RepID=UPI003418D4D5